MNDTTTIKEVDATAAEVAAHNAKPEVQSGLEQEWKQTREAQQRENANATKAAIIARFKTIADPLNKQHGTDIRADWMRASYSYEKNGLVVKGSGWGNHLGNYKFGKDGQPNWEKIEARCKAFAEVEAQRITREKKSESEVKAGEKAFGPYKERAQKAFGVSISASMQDGKLHLRHSYPPSSLFSGITVEQLEALIALREKYNQDVEELTKEEAP